MPVVDHRKFGVKQPRAGMPQWLKTVSIVTAVLAIVFVLVNVGMGIVYHNKVLPNYSVAAVPIGNIAFADLDDKISVETLLPKQITLKKKDTSKQVVPKDLGVTVDWAATQEHIKTARSWLPFTSLFLKHSVPAELKTDNAKFAMAAKDLEATFTQEALPERVAFKDGNFAVVAPEAGYRINTSSLRLAIIHSLEQGKATLTVPTTVIDPPAATGNLQGAVTALQKQLDAKITLVHGSQSRQLTRANIAGFYEPSGQTLTLSSTKIREAIVSVASGMGVTAVNLDEAVYASLYALSKQQTVTFVLAGQGAKVYHYCTAVRGVSASVLPEFRQKLAAVYADPKGWNDGGKRAMVYADSNCDYTAWLSAPASMTSFGGVCDDYYSCRSGPNVVINYDRWMGATDPWNAAGGSLEDYRVMVINHETGHWLGFAHRNCTGAGQPAPVMQQQSIDLQGCTFNPWPTAAELAAL